MQPGANFSPRRSKKRPGTVWIRHHIDIVKKRENQLSGEHPFPHFRQGIVDRQTEKAETQGDAETVFGQSIVGHPHLTNLGQSNFVCCCGVVVVVVVVCVVVVWCGPEGLGGPKFRVFFSPSPATIFFLSSLSLGVFVEIWWCF